MVPVLRQPTVSKALSLLARKPLPKAMTYRQPSHRIFTSKRLERALTSDIPTRASLRKSGNLCWKILPRRAACAWSFPVAGPFDLWVPIHGHAAAVIGNFQGDVLIQHDIDPFGKASNGSIHAIADDLPAQMVGGGCRYTCLSALNQGYPPDAFNGGDIVFIVAIDFE